MLVSSARNATVIRSRTFCPSPPTPREHICKGEATLRGSPQGLSSCNTGLPGRLPREPQARVGHPATARRRGQLFLLPAQNGTPSRGSGGGGRTREAATRQAG